jgi:hypothetical protein
MKQFAPFIRPVILLAVICASSMLLSGCGDKLLESKETEFLLADPLENRRATEPPQHRRSADHPASSANSIQRGPLLVGAANNQTLDPVPVMRLMRVAVDLFPPVDCDKPPAWLMESRALDFPAQVDEGRLVDLGKPVRSVELWVVPASRDGAYIDVNIAPDSAEGRVIAMKALTPELSRNFTIVRHLIPPSSSVPPGLACPCVRSNRVARCSSLPARTARALRARRTTDCRLA